ncbi:MAG: hypothetical protein ABI625_24630 [bacterium]
MKRLKVARLLSGTTDCSSLDVHAVTLFANQSLAVRNDSTEVLVIIRDGRTTAGLQDGPAEYSAIQGL